MKNSDVALDESRHDTTSRFDIEGERSDIEDQEVLSIPGSFASKDDGLDGGSIGKSPSELIDLFSSLLLKKSQLGDAWYTGRTPHE